MSGLYDSPPPSWYEPPDLIEEGDEPTWPAETLTVTGGVVWWTASTDDDDDDEEWGDDSAAQRLERGPS